MNKRKLNIINLILLASCAPVSSNIDTTSTPDVDNFEKIVFSGDRSVNKTIHGIKDYPNLTSAFRYYDYLEAARELDRVVFSFANDPHVKLPTYVASDPSSWDPIGYWLDQPRMPTEYNPLETGYLKRTFGLPTYLGDNRVLSAGSEAMTTIAMVLGSSYAGIDKQNQKFGDDTYDFVEMTFASYDTGSKLVHNYGVQGQSFWYDLFPQIMFARLYALYPQTPYMEQIVLNGAEQWLKALPFFVKNNEPNYEFVGYNVVLDAPTVTGGHIEPPNGGLAFIFYSAYEISKDERFLEGAKQVLDYLQTYDKNPNYEALTDYAPYVAAALNLKYNTNYDVGKFLDYLFEGDSAFRAGWQVMANSFGSYPVHGLVGQNNDYAFTMNSFHLATTLAPLVKYDPRFANDIGRYFLNLVNNAAHFYPQSHSLQHQSMDNFIPFDLKGSLAYEGFRHHYNGVTGYAMGDATTMFSQPSDLSLYSSALTGALGAIVSRTNKDAILQIDLNVTDSFKSVASPTYLFYNPYENKQIIHFDGPINNKYNLFDLRSQTVIAENVQGTVNISVDGKESLVVMVIENNSYPTIHDEFIYIGDAKIAKKKAAINLINLSSKQQLTGASNILINVDLPKGDEPTELKISFDNITVYQGPFIESYQYNKSDLPDTDYTLKVEITTKNNHYDYATKRVVCR